MQDNVFDENVDYLYQVRADLEAVEQLKKELAEYKSQEKNLKKAIASEEKSIQDEINQTIRKRKNEIEKTYDDQIDTNKDKTRSVKAKRDKVKSKRMGERVSMETADLTEENRQLNMEMKTLFKAQHVPAFCKSDFFYSLFMTKRVSEFFVLLISLVVAYVGIPTIMYMLSVNVFFKESKQMTLLSTLTVSLTLFVLGLIYVTILNRVKLRHYDILLEGRNYKDQIAANEKQMKAIKNKISKDKDDSVYGLDKYDDMLSELEDELDQISEEKQNALTVFENDTKQLLINEVNDRRLGKVEQMKADVEHVEESAVELDNNIQNASRAIVNNYGAILGKEFCNPDRVEDLISLMEDGSADTVSEAIAAYKGAGKA